MTKTFKKIAVAATTIIASAATMLTLTCVAGCGKVNPEDSGADFVADGYSLGYNVYFNGTRVETPADITDISLYKNLYIDLYIKDKDGAVVKGYNISIQQEETDFLEIMPYATVSGAVFYEVKPVGKGEGKVTFLVYDREEWNNPTLLARKTINFTVFDTETAYDAPEDYIAEGYTCVMADDQQKWETATREVTIAVGDDLMIAVRDPDGKLIDSKEYFIHHCPDYTDFFTLCPVSFNGIRTVDIKGTKEGTDIATFLFGLNDDQETILCRKTFIVTVKAK